LPESLSLKKSFILIDRSQGSQKCQGEEVYFITGAGIFMMDTSNEVTLELGRRSRILSTKNFIQLNIS